MSRLSLVVREKRKEADDTYSLRLGIPEESAEAFRYQPGQFVNIRALVDEQVVERSYSLSSSPEVDAYFQITVKRIENGVLSPVIADMIAVGHELEVSTPQGRFYEGADDAPRHYLLFGAGSGVTPLFSILKWVLARNQGDRVTLVFGSRRESSIIFERELKQFETKYAGRLRTIHVLSQPTESWNGERGRIDRAKLLRLLDQSVRDRNLPETAYLCGPAAFMEECGAALRELGLDPGDIHRESFAVGEAVSAAELDDATTVRIEPESGTAGPPAPCETLTVVIDGEETEIVLELNETILAGVLRHGLDAPFSCQEGTCLSCMCRVEEGAVRMKHYDLIGLSEDDLGKGIALACLSRPDSSNVRLSFEDV
jgi:ferredoxin-NADP reductase